MPKCGFCISTHQRYNNTMSSWMNVCLVFVSSFFNHSSVSVVILHCWSENFFLTFSLVFCNIILLILLLYVFVELMSLHFALLGKYSLWSLSVMYALFFAIGSTLSLI